MEQIFLVTTTLLATPPIFPRTDAAIRGHIFCQMPGFAQLYDPNVRAIYGAA